MRGRHRASSFDRDQRTEQARRRFDQDRQQYEATNNPVFAWRAYATATAFDVPIPTWVFNYFDVVAENLTILLNMEPREGEIRPGLVAALGFAPGGAELTLSHTLQSLSDDSADSRQIREEIIAGSPRENVGDFNPLALAGGNDPAFKLASIVALFEQMNPTENRTTIVKTVAQQEGVSASTVWRAIAKLSAVVRKQRKRPSTSKRLP